MDVEDFDLYGDLEDFDYKQKFTEQEIVVQELRNKLENTLKVMTTLEAENKTLKKQVDNIGKSFHSLLQTAKSEIKRKDTQIMNLRKEKDNILFRRSKRFHPYEDEFVCKQTERYESDSVICPTSIDLPHHQQIITTQNEVHTEQNLSTASKSSYGVPNTFNEIKTKIAVSHDLGEQRPDSNNDQLESIDKFNDGLPPSNALRHGNLESCLSIVPAQHPRDFKEIHKPNGKYNQNEENDQRNPKPRDLKKNINRKHDSDNVCNSKEKNSCDRKYDRKSKEKIIENSNQDSKTKNNVDLKANRHSREEKDHYSKRPRDLKDKYVRDRKRDHDHMPNSKERDNKYDRKSKEQIIENQDLKRKNDSDLKFDRNIRGGKNYRAQEPRDLKKRDVRDRIHDRDRIRNSKEKDHCDLKYARNSKVQVTESRDQGLNMEKEIDRKDKRGSRDFKYDHGRKYDCDPIRNSKAVDNRDKDRLNYDKYNSNETRSSSSYGTSKHDKRNCRDTLNHKEESDTRSLKRRHEDTDASDIKRKRYTEEKSKKNTKSIREKTEGNIEKMSESTSRTRNEKLPDLLALSESDLNLVKVRLREELFDELTDDEVTFPKLENRDIVDKKSLENLLTSSKRPKNSIFDETFSDVLNDVCETPPMEFGPKIRHFETEDLSKKRADLSDGEIEDDDIFSEDIAPQKSTSRSKSKEKFISNSNVEDKSRKSEIENRVEEENVHSKKSTDRTDEKLKVVGVEKDIMIRVEVAEIQIECKDPVIEIDQKGTQTAESETSNLLNDKPARLCTSTRTPTTVRSPTTECPVTSVRPSTPVRHPTSVSPPTSVSLPTSVSPPIPVSPLTPVLPLTDQSQLKSLIKDIAAKPANESEHYLFSNETRFGQTKLLTNRNIIYEDHKETTVANVSKTLTIPTEVTKIKDLLKKSKRVPLNRTNKSNCSAETDIEAICLYRAYLVDPTSALSPINGSTEILETILSDSPNKSKKRQRKSPIYGSKRMVGHKIEGFEPIRSSEESSLVTSRELKHELFKEILGPFNSTVRTDKDVSDGLNASNSSICFDETNNTSKVCNENEQLMVTAKVQENHLHCKEPSIETAMDAENASHIIKSDQNNLSHKSPPESNANGESNMIDSEPCIKNSVETENVSNMIKTDQNNSSHISPLKSISTSESNMIDSSSADSSNCNHRIKESSASNSEPGEQCDEIQADSHTIFKTKKHKAMAQLIADERKIVTEEHSSVLNCDSLKMQSNDNGQFIGCQAMNDTNVRDESSDFQSQEIDPNYTIDLFGSQEIGYTIGQFEDKNEEECNSETNDAIKNLQQNYGINLIEPINQEIYHDRPETEDHQNTKRIITEYSDLETYCPKIKQINLGDRELGRFDAFEAENIYRPESNNTNNLSHFNSQKTVRSDRDNKTVDSNTLGSKSILVLENQLDSDNNTSNFNSLNINETNFADIVTDNSSKNGPVPVNSSQQDSHSQIIADARILDSAELIDNQFSGIQETALKGKVEILDIEIISEGHDYQNSVDKSEVAPKLFDEINRVSKDNLFESTVSNEDCNNKIATRRKRQKISFTLPDTPKQSKSAARKRTKHKSSRNNTSQNCIIRESANEILNEDFSSLTSETEHTKKQDCRQIEADVKQVILKSSELAQIKFERSHERAEDIPAVSMEVIKQMSEQNHPGGSGQQTNVGVSLSDSAEPEPEKLAPSRLSFPTTPPIINNSSLSDSSIEKRNISIASSDYMIETINQNVVNVFVTRKKIKKKKNKC